MIISKRALHQTLACSPVILNQFLIGIGWGWIAPTLAKIRRPECGVPNVTSDQASWLASINEVGRVLGPFISPFLVDHAGRKFTLVLVTVGYFLVWLSTVFTRDISILCAIRFFFGLMNGINDVVAGVYTTENCSPSLRAVIGGVVQLMFAGGMFVEFVIASCLSETGTAIANTAMTVCVLATLFFGTESPYFLIMKGKREKAEKNLTWLSGNADRVEVIDELHRIEESVQEEKRKTKSLRLLFASKTNIKALTIVVCMHVLNIMTGGTAFMSFSSLIFSSSETLTANQFMIAFGVVGFTFVNVSPLIVEKLERRSLVIGCSVGITISSICSYLLMRLHNNGFDIAHYPWLIFASVCSYSVFDATMSAAFYALKGELLPLSVRAIGSGMAVTAQSITSFGVTKMFFPISERYGMETNFLIFAISCMVSTVFVYCVLPETRGKTLHELQNMQNRTNKGAKMKDEVELAASSCSVEQ